MKNNLERVKIKINTILTDPIVDHRMKLSKNQQQPKYMKHTICKLNDKVNIKVDSRLNLYFTFTNDFFKSDRESEPFLEN